jgi:stress response protein YsnF
MLGLFKHDNEREHEDTSRQPTRRHASSDPGLELQASFERRPDGLTIRLPLRSEEVIVEKRAVTAEQVVVRRGFRTEVEHFSESVRREDVEIEEDSPYARTERIERT